MKKADSKEMAQTQLSLQQDSHQKFADLLLIIQLLTYRVGEMTVTIGILIGSSSLDDKWQDVNLSYQHIYKAFKINNRKRKRGES